LLNNSVVPLIENINHYLYNIERILDDNFKDFGANDGINYISRVITADCRFIQ
jgi:hypothetical protein